MRDDYDHLDNITRQFHDRIVSNQKLLNDLRKEQFQSMARKDSKIDVEKIRFKISNIKRKESQQTAILAKEMNELLIQKLEHIKRKEEFSDKEKTQKKIIRQELENEIIKSELKFPISPEIQDKLIPIIMHLDLVLARTKNNIHKNYLDEAKKNIITYLEHVNLDSNQ